MILQTLAGNDMVYRQGWPDANTSTCSVMQTNKEK